VSANRSSKLRLVSLAPSATSILCAIGARHNLVGVTKWCVDIAPVARLPKLGDCWAMGSVDEILQLKPNLVIGSVPYKAETVAKLFGHPLNFLAMNPRSLADVYADIRLLGGIVQRSRQAERLVTQMRSVLAAIETRAAERKSAKANPKPKRSGGSHPPRVYCEAWPNPRISSPPWVAEVVRIAGGKFVTQAGARISDEDVATANPDIIVLAWAAVGAKSRPQRAYAVPAWKNVAAIRNHQVHVIRDELLNTPGPPLLQGASALEQITRRWHKEQDGALS
jgi:iron complex transport system substrate-binding protein